MTPDDLLDEGGTLLLVTGFAQGDVAAAQYFPPVVPVRNKQPDAWTASAMSRGEA